MTASGRSWPANHRDSGSHSLARFGKIPNRNTDDDKQDAPLLQTTAAFPATGRARVFGAYRTLGGPGGGETGGCAEADGPGALPGQTTTRVPNVTRPYRSSISSLSRRMQPEDTN